ncbi:MAG: hypothetical protein LBQ84_08880 [Flavobacteriaceae bacterium]|jgi:hypothetical protein|nr:hypothetical protein [Flavobacteriaceae bacterium]
MSIKPKFDIIHAILALREIGTTKSIEYLKNIACYKNMDIQGSSVLTIAKLSNGRENDFFGKLLLDKEYKSKWYAMWAIFFKANEKALPYVLEYGVNKVKNCKKIPECGWLILLYLARYAPDNEQSRKIFSRINKDFENMPSYIGDELKKEFPDIFGK